MVWLIPLGYLLGMAVYVFAYAAHDGFGYEEWEWALVSGASLMWPVWLLFAAVCAPAWVAGRIWSRR